ncbi:UNKNOWN [Stylonychia lemnae]|uniref:Uncharacterized protein n=1 Tax=Stylonychia lemnae TaxID=5949 RepID=A0A078AYP4_STYLE|nr:UNKNOWN [Stylonychia lemnae]|eukprot:CDW87289.1 UNKNOWN [Stylonychia lemnae]
MEKNPQIFTDQEIKEYKSYKNAIRLGIFDLLIYIGIGVYQTSAFSQAKKTLIFPSARFSPGLSMLRLFLLNMAMAEYLVGTYHLSWQKYQLGEKYFSNLRHPHIGNVQVQPPVQFIQSNQFLPQHSHRSMLHQQQQYQPKQIDSLQQQQQQQQQILSSSSPYI